MNGLSERSWTRPRGSLAAFALALALAAACGSDGFAPTRDVAAPPDSAGEADAATAPDTVRPPDAGATRDAPAPSGPKQPPRIVLDGPANGLWAVGMAEVIVTGRVTPGSAPVTSLTLNGEQVTRSPDGRFAVPVRPAAGVNRLGLRAEAEDGGRAVDARAFFSGEVHAPDAVLPRAVWSHARPEFLDDDDDDPDDLARLLELLLENPEFLALLQDPIDTGAVAIQPREVTVAGADVDIFADEGVLSLTVSLDEPVIRFETVPEPGEAATPGSIRATRAELFLQIALDVQGGVVTTEARNPDVILEGFEMQAELLDGFDDPAVRELVRSVVEEGIEAEVGAQVGDLLGALVGSLAFDFTYGETVPIRFQLALNELHVTRAGLHAVLDASATAPPGAGVHNAEIAGSLRTTSTPPPLAFGESPLAFAVDDDLLNQLAFAYWYGGGLTRLEFGAADMESVGATDLPDVFTPLDRVTVSATLPLVVTAQPEVEGFPFALGVGDMEVVLRTGDARRFAMFLSFAAGVDLAVGEGGLATFRADRRPRHVPIDVAAYAVPGGNDPGNIAALVRMMVPPILGRTNEGLPGFPIPAVPLAPFLDFPSVADKEFALPDVRFRTAGAEGHFVVLEGAPVMRDVQQPLAVSR